MWPPIIIMPLFAADSKSSMPAYCPPLVRPLFATGRWFAFPEWSYSSETVQMVLAQKASCMAVSGKPSGSIGMSLTVPPEPVFIAELPLLTW